MSDAWISLRRFTQARIALGRAGHALPSKELIEFQLAHAQARDAVQLPWDIETFAKQLRGVGENVIVLDTPAAGRDQYLRRPDRGRVLTGESRDRLRRFAGAAADLALVVSNGLSSTAVERHGIGLLREVLQGCREQNLRLTPLCLVPNGRVALSDDIGHALGARLAVIIVGERPGLSAADSLGIYLIFAPRPGNTDAQRNCISNIRPPEGLAYDQAAAKLLYLAGEALRRGLSGVGLKDEMNDMLAGE